MDYEPRKTRSSGSTKLHLKDELILPSNGSKGPNLDGVYDYDDNVCSPRNEILSLWVAFTGKNGISVTNKVTMYLITKIY